ncbi:oligosaccharide flippase family protein [bacterium]|nr:oligosaccharide flippase family protein [candidate division CSSED10-310 bacterium]
MKIPDLRTSSSTSVSAIVVGGGDVIVKIVSLAVTIILMRIFTPSDYGILTTLLTFIMVLPLFMDLGTTPSMIRFGPFLEAKGLVKQRDELFKTSLALRIIVGLLMFGAVFPFRKMISSYFLHDSGLSMLVTLMLLATLSTSFTQFIAAIFQSRERFLKMSVTKFVEALLKLVSIAVLWVLLPSIGLSHVMIIYGLAPLMTVILFFSEIRKLIRVSFLPVQKLKQIARISFWYMCSNIFLMIFVNFDILIIAAIGSQQDVGLFGAGYKLASVLGLIVNALFTVFMPQASRKVTSGDLIKYLGKISIVCALLAIAAFPFAFSGHFLVSSIAGDAYVTPDKSGELSNHLHHGVYPRVAEDVFFLTVCDHSVMILFIPFMICLFTVNRPILLALFSALEMILNIIGDVIFVPLYGPAGAAAVTLTVRMTVGTWGSIYLYRKLKQNTDFIQQVF